MFRERNAILVLEADRDRQTGACAALQGGGFAVEVAQDADHVLMLLTEHRFDAVLAASEPPHQSGLELLKTLRERALSVPVALTTQAPHLETAIAAMRLGAVDYLALPIAPAELVTRVGEAASRSAQRHAIAEAQQQAAQLAVSAGALEAALSRTLPPSGSRIRAAAASPLAAPELDEEQLSRLSPREREIAGLLAQGKAVSELATSLALSPNTVRNHVKSIFGKLRVHSQVALLSRLSGHSR